MRNWYNGLLYFRSLENLVVVIIHLIMDAIGIAVQFYVEHTVHGKTQKDLIVWQEALINLVEFQVLY